jgi:glycerol-3-phosphate dehydrogenase
MERTHTEIVIVGSGIAGLWLFRKLKNRGIAAILLEKDAIGGVQTLASQGMIHGGQRYHLQGKNSQQGDDIAAMPALWARCFAGDGPVDLTNVAILSKNQYLWSPGGLTSGVTAFLASKAMNSKVRSLENSQLPEVFTDAKRFKGHVYEMDEWVVDVKSLVTELVGTDSTSIYAADVLGVTKSAGGNPVLEVLAGGSRMELEAGAVVFAAGLGNEKPIRDLQLDRVKPKTQRRPLKQIMVRGVAHQFFAHCIAADPRPRMTISAHAAFDGSYVWYLGGIVAEYGLNRTDAEAIAFARKELESLFPWLNWSNKEWACCHVDRAEPFFDGNFLKSGPEFLTHEQIGIAWPTKLTFAPVLANQIDLWIEQLGLGSSTKSIPAIGISTHPKIGQFPWEATKWHR